MKKLLGRISHFKLYCIANRQTTVTGSYFRFYAGNVLDDFLVCNRAALIRAGDILIRRVGPPAEAPHRIIRPANGANYCEFHIVFGDTWIWLRRDRVVGGIGATCRNSCIGRDNSVDDLRCWVALNGEPGADFRGVRRDVYTAAADRHSAAAVK